MKLVLIGKINWMDQFAVVRSVSFGIYKTELNPLYLRFLYKKALVLERVNILIL